MNLRSPHDATLYVRAAMSAAESHTAAAGDAVIYSHVSPDKDTPNEDAAAIIPYDAGSAVLVVADGLGGQRAGDVASNAAIGALRDALEKAAAEQAPLRTAILDAIETANKTVLETGLGAATTLAAVEIFDGCARTYHIGDSMALITGQRGKIKLQTICHSPVGFAVEAGVLDEKEAINHEDRHIVSNIVGSPDMRIEIGSAITLAEHDTVLLASDGLFDNMHVDEIVNIVRAGSLTDAAAKLAAEAQMRMMTPEEDHPCKPDDLTFILFRRRAKAPSNSKVATPAAG
ncbi:serine/threonine-protein phosphatase [Planctomycetales bacterium ZRK34]|nr:serine/threonine-protein phosphatase [Planctomycetales bacterium ZRK34]